MTFANLGLAMAGVACVAIPIIIHLLFRRRRKPIVWGAMRFLIEAYRRQRRRLTLEQIILLATRCAIVVCVALAVGRPVLEAMGAVGGASARTVHILIDNALASSALASDAPGAAPALDRHKRAAKEILASLAGADRAGLIALGAPADAIVSPPSSDLAAVGAMIDALAPTAGAADLAGALETLAAALRAEGEAASGDAFVVILSDFWEGSADLSRPLPRLALDDAITRRVRVLASAPATSAPGNVQVVSVDPLRSMLLAGPADSPAAADAESVRVTLRRTGPAVADASPTSVRLRVSSPRAGLGAGAEIASAVVRWAPGQSEASATLAADPAAIVAAAGDSAAAALVAEIDRDAIDADNSYRRPVEVRPGLRVGIVARRRFGGPLRADRMAPEDWLRLALRPTEDSPIEIIGVEPGAIDAPTLASLDVVLLPRPDQITDDGWPRLRAFLDAGGLIVAFPAPDASVHLWSDPLQSALGFPWTIARETLALDPPGALDVQQPAGSMLGLIAGEFESLARRVEFFKILPIDEPGAARAGALLRLAGGVPLALAARPNRAGAETADDTNGPVRAPEPRDSRGLLVYFAVSPTLDWTDLPAKPLFVPLLHEMIRQGAGAARGSWTARAGERPDAPAHAVELRPLDDRRTPGAAAREPISLDRAGRALAPVRHTGLFRAVDDRGASRGLVAVNADADAGRTNIQAAQPVQAWIGGAGLAASAVELIDTRAPEDRAGDPSSPSAAAFLAGAQSGSAISLPLLIGALALAAMETLMARFFSHAGVGRDGPAPGPARVAGEAA